MGLSKVGFIRVFACLVVAASLGASCAMSQEMQIDKLYGIHRFKSPTGGSIAGQLAKRSSAPIYQPSCFTISGICQLAWVL